MSVQEGKSDERAKRKPREVQPTGNGPVLLTPTVTGAIVTQALVKTAILHASRGPLA
jgi:hypothetical protein